MRIIIQIAAYALLALGHRLAKRYLNLDAEILDYSVPPKRGLTVEKPLVARRKTISVWYDC